jgi:hypothetical protein
VTVWLGSRYRARHDPANCVFLQRPTWFEAEDERADEAQLNDPGPGYLNFLAIGGVSFLLVGHQLPDTMDVGYDGPLAEALIRIGPARASEVE